LLNTPLPDERNGSPSGLIVSFQYRFFQWQIQCRIAVYTVHHVGAQKKAKGNQTLPVGDR
jgi:hypothetical protein